MLLYKASCVNPWYQETFFQAGAFLSSRSLPTHHRHEFRERPPSAAFASTQSWEQKPNMSSGQRCDWCGLSIGCWAGACVVVTQRMQLLPNPSAMQCIYWISLLFIMFVAGWGLCVVCAHCFPPCCLGHAGRSQARQLLVSTAAASTATPPSTDSVIKVC